MRQQKLQINILIFEATPFTNKAPNAEEEGHGR
jgi:hypothetical protein